LNKSGSTLEQFVAAIEEFLLPKGFSVKTRKKVFDETGVQIAEFDMEISGKLGSTNIKWLIECRDRPSEGSSPVSWIEQLVGRRSRFNFNKVTAVSTTGFSSSAREYAKLQGIELREIQEIDIYKLQNWFQVEEIKFASRHADISNAQIYLAHKPDNDTLEKLNAIISMGPRIPILIHSKSKNIFSILDAWKDLVNQKENLFDSIIPGEQPVQRTIDVSYPNPDSRYTLFLSDKYYDITRIIFEAEFYIEEFVVPMENIQEYTNLSENTVIAQSVHYQIHTSKSDVELGFHRIKSDNSKGEYIISFNASGLKNSEDNTSE
jgi:hypothetical protein